MNPVLTVLLDAQVKSFQRRTKSGGVTQVKGFERRGQPGSNDPSQRRADRQANVQLKAKLSPEERAKLIGAAKRAKAALEKGASKSAFRLARAFYELKAQMMGKAQAKDKQKELDKKKQNGNLSN